jgi:hypothetical protein|tara:strand:+ start:6132 stop:6413 length:282 start_codon:yes stop_codon:yes gene_type:complete
MESKIIKFMIDHQYLKTNCIINATFSAPGVGGLPVQVTKDLLYEDCAETPKGKIYVKGCDPENLREYVVGASKVHQLNGMDQTTIERLYPEMP